MQGNDHVSAAEPNWLDQAEEQMSALYRTLEEIGDDACIEAFDQLDRALLGVRRRAVIDGVEQRDDERRSQENEVEAAYDRQQESLMESGGPDDSAYRRDVIAAGRGHLIR